MATTILVLGAGTGGIITAMELNKTVGNDGEVNPVKILVFEKEEKNVFAPSLLWLMVGKRKPEQVFRNTRKIAGDGIDLVIGEIQAVNPEQISVTVKGQEYKGDYMVISLGVDQVPEYNLNSYGHDFYTLDGATNFNEQLQNFKGGEIAVLVPSLPFKCPAAPYEAAMLIESYIRKKGLGDKTEISLYTPEPGPMGVAGKELSGAVRQMVEMKGIKYFPEHQLTSATDKTLTFSNGKTADFDLLAYTPKHQCPSVIKATSLVGKLGWIEVDRHTMETNFPNVYAIGDITFIPLEMGKPLPKAGVFAHYQAETVAHNVAQKIAGKPSDKTFNGDGQCFLELGGGKAGYAGGNFYGSPLPIVKMKKPGYFWHWTKVWFEKYWWFRYF
ncbi:MAG: NAD(P)/FAD-dependent oxidoreductase [Saprospiraceae bacterium]|nr:NAD(P)/FAD-dependent oxidoreductase [Saprospiraceae bacterium]MCF8251548.1 NAD(P)/FAD-dependent oxidoreductase [Saprospiraceae bacterium]MCF8280878.1 NAD(P)/FAD-dependent oxidoreductase [Bacteroidales bacterium]MCF8310942.1 NAD(P)/FAD-dependent oxidoreductase [Saprospiraceae bacterium]MCF8439722.1 NAD(P)/FAD-dependent oxidoreductase [Saprospiraceae bacterium]